LLSFQELRRGEAFSRLNLGRLGIVSFVLSFISTLQSFYLVKVVNVYSEVNNIAGFFFSHGILGYVLYVPVAFVGTFATFVVLWGCASYIMWYYTSVIKYRTSRWT